MIWLRVKLRSGLCVSLVPNAIEAVSESEDGYACVHTTSGQVWESEIRGQGPVDCPNCGGRGHTVGTAGLHDCRSCGTTGKVPGLSAEQLLANGLANSFAGLVGKLNRRDVLLSKGPVG
jgi:ribosomal protein L37AE/L43A